MKTWADFLDDLMPELPGADVPIVEAALVRAAIEFCDKARVYRGDHPAIDAVAEQGTYSWEPTEENVEVCHIFHVWYAGEQLTPRSGEYLADTYDYWPEETGTPAHYHVERTDALIVVPAPAEALEDAIVAKVALRPTLDATGIPDDLFAEYRGAIAAGAMSRLMRMQKKPWTNYEMANAYGQAFRSAIEDASHRMQAGHVRSAHYVANGRKRFL
jgi:hypothetical protein